MNNITLGQYYPAKSLIHSLDARVKVVLAVLYIVCSFLCKNLISYAVLLLSAIILILVSRIPLKMILRSLRPILFILLFTVIINMFWTEGERLLVDWWIINIYYEGVLNAVFIGIRIIVLIIDNLVKKVYTILDKYFLILIYSERIC